MAGSRPGYFWMSPVDQEGNKFQPKIVVKSDRKSLEYHFTATIVMDQEAYLRLAQDNFKMICHLESKEDAEKRDNDYRNMEGQFAPE